MRRLIAASGLAALLALAALAASPEGMAQDAAPRERERSERENPHGAADGCLACHAPPAEPGEGEDKGEGKPEGYDAAVEVGPALPVVETCRSCHPTADMHPVSIAPDEVPVPEGWPLEDGLVVCSTCHAEPAHGGGAEDLPAPYHRGGPYAEVIDFCYVCHERLDYEREDPHHPAAARSNDDPSCAACHTTAPEPGASFAESRLRESPEETCGTCHEGSIHQGAAEHVGETVDEAVRAALPPGIALTADGTIGCWSCHEVHLDPAPSAARRYLKGHPLAEDLTARARAEDWAERIDPEAARWPGASDEAHPPMLPLPTEDGALCRACHGAGP